MAALIDHVYKDHAGYWSVVAFFEHPNHQPYHKNWSGNYVIVQEYGNYKNTMRIILAEDFDSLFSLAWEPLKECKFCGFMRMVPCVKRQNCPSLKDHHLEPQETIEETDHVPTS